MADLLGLLNVKRFARLIDLQCRALQVHTALGCPLRSRIGGRSPPDPLPEPLRMRLKAKQARRIGEHGAGIRLGKTPAAQQLEEHFGVMSAHVRGRPGGRPKTAHLRRRCGEQTKPPG